MPFDDDEEDDESADGDGDGEGEAEGEGEEEDEVARAGDDDTPLHSETLKEEEAPSNRTSNVSDAPSSAKEEDGDGEAPQSPIHPESLASASSPSRADPASAPEASAEETGHESASSSFHSPIMAIQHFPVPMQQSPNEKSHLEHLNEWELHKKESERSVKPKTSRDGFSIISATLKRAFSSNKGNNNNNNTPGINTPGSVGRRSRSNSVATRRDVESAASRESAASAISGRVE